MQLVGQQTQMPSLLHVADVTRSKRYCNGLDRSVRINIAGLPHSNTMYKKFDVTSFQSKKVRTPAMIPSSCHQTYGSTRNNSHLLTEPE